jgi:flagellar biosynthetic protein FliP
VYDLDQSLINVNGNQVPTLDILLMMTIVSLLPSLLIMVTSFARTTIILSFLRNAMGVQQTPPNMVLIGIAIFLTLFIMDPVIKQINTEAYTPYKNQEITQAEAIDRAQVPLKEFMLRNTEKSSLKMFLDLSGREDVQVEEQAQLLELPMTVIIPSFMTSELKKGFTAGFLLYLPFLLIDIVVSSTLMSMGMMMLPPAMISMPFKLLLFVTVDGWELLFSTIANSFH